MFLPKHNSFEPPWYGPVCPVVWEGRGCKAPPYPDQSPSLTECQQALVVNLLHLREMLKLLMSRLSSPNWLPIAAGRKNPC